MSPESRKTFLGCLFLLALFAAVPYSWWANAFVLCRIWDWYRPTNVAALPFKSALGVSFIVDVLRTWRRRQKKEHEDDWGAEAEVVTALAKPWLILGAARFCYFIFFE